MTKKKKSASTKKPQTMGMAQMVYNTERDDEIKTLTEEGMKSSIFLIPPGLQDTEEKMKYITIFIQEPREEGASWVELQQSTGRGSSVLEIINKASQYVNIESESLEVPYKDSLSLIDVVGKKK